MVLSSGFGEERGVVLLRAGSLKRALVGTVRGVDHLILASRKKRVPFCLRSCEAIVK